MLLFLDFDGVLHSAYSFNTKQLYSQIPIFEQFFRQPENANIQFVISSTWRYGRDLHALRQPFSPDIATRIIGKTPEDVATTRIGSREQEILQYLHDTQREAEPWIALDDVRSYFSRHLDRVYLCKPHTGLTLQDLPKLAQLINDFQTA
ncbi:HAD domain-containing protein [Kingella negevensis]|uniref:5' nucleotidase, deoxy (Pyrimidine), cytosolic type C protein (NT5C) n=1 Tax=Kingella negevensis TaxID=1522312 RepID=A0A238HHZ8_9NEIS|nr:HAD domain-containing protein [Kingella negevensis]MDK4679863.1 HAD domain-containing protein [Kingella negevensis]MDK4682418.1 HAD domain-containing protein [Kingella negevensis]MDK4685521.1 HAD domain-containing protein [Kingella negevensis]MDK4690615.1 HAD domain-containing protein [Kingella negevensis]MDK4692036.1 HAD domain-containing protein [Kingella negevensis]